MQAKGTWGYQRRLQSGRPPPQSHASRRVLPHGGVAEAVVAADCFPPSGSFSSALQLRPRLLASFDSRASAKPEEDHPSNWKRRAPQPLQGGQHPVAHELQGGEDAVAHVLQGGGDMVGHVLWLCLCCLQAAAVMVVMVVWGAVHRPFQGGEHAEVHVLRLLTLGLHAAVAVA